MTTDEVATELIDGRIVEKTTSFLRLRLLQVERDVDDHVLLPADHPYPLGAPRLA
jgi:hypothetical protein